MDLFCAGSHVLSSGQTSDYKIDCDALSDGSIQTLAKMIKKLVGPFSSVEGIPRGGLRLASALEVLVETHGPHLIVDDVLTTGKSMTKAGERWMAKWMDGSIPIDFKFMGAVIFARGPLPSWIQAVCSLPPALWLDGPRCHYPSE